MTVGKVMVDRLEITRLVSGRSSGWWYGIPTPLKNHGVSSSVGMTIPTEWKNLEVKNVPNQAVLFQALP